MSVSLNVLYAVDLCLVDRKVQYMYYILYSRVRFVDRTCIKYSHVLFVNRTCMIQ